MRSASGCGARSRTPSPTWPRSTASSPATAYVAAPAKDADLGRRVAELGALYVDPAHWRKGAGEALVRATLERLAALPYDEVVLWTFTENAPAIALYERYGWRRDGAEKIHARSGVPAVRFSRPVTMDAQ